jgi:hypothetical protein
LGLDGSEIADSARDRAILRLRDLIDEAEEELLKQFAALR